MLRCGFTAGRPSIRPSGRAAICRAGPVLEHAAPRTAAATASEWAAASRVSGEATGPEECFVRYEIGYPEEIAPVELTLVETETFFLLDEPGSAVGLDAPDMENVKAMNAAYEELLEKRSTMADMYVESPAQTFNMDMKPKEQQTTMVESSKMGTQATEWSIYDTFAGDTPPMDADEASVVPGDELAPEKGERFGCFT